MSAGNTPTKNDPRMGATTRESTSEEPNKSGTEQMLNRNTLPSLADWAEEVLAVGWGYGPVHARIAAALNGAVK
jgi:hypothetical protein